MQKEKNVITCPSTNSCGVLQPTHKQPTQIPIFCLSLHRNHGRCCAHTNFTETHLAGMMGPSPHLLDVCSWVYLAYRVDTLMHLVCVSFYPICMGTTQTILTIDVEEETHGLNYENIPAEHMLPHPSRAYLAILTVF